MNPFDDKDKIYMTFELRGHGKEQIINCEYDDSVHWSEVIDDVVKQIEACWGYSFNISKDHEIGVYYPGKNDDSK